MNVHQPNCEKRIQNHLAETARLLRHLGADDWADDIEQTAHSIQMEFDEERELETTLKNLKSASNNIQLT